MDIKPSLNIDQGFIKKPYAIRKQVTNPDGSIQTVFVDAKSGKPIANPDGYQIVQQSVPTPVVRNDSSRPSNTDIVSGQKNDKSSVSKAVSASKSDGSDLGYTNKPGVMSVAGFLPGPLGLGGMAANLGVNAANQKAVSDQRSVLGFSTEPGKRALGTVIDTNGYIGEGKVTAPSGKTSIAPVSFEGTDANNRTAYTPEEARKREMMGLLKQATPEEQKAAIGTFNNEFPEQATFSSKLASASKSLFTSLFGSSSTTASGAGTGLGFNNGSASGAYGNSFPTAPSAPTNTATGLDTGRGPSVDTSGMSPGLY